MRTLHRSLSALAILPLALCCVATVHAQQSTIGEQPQPTGAPSMSLPPSSAHEQDGLSPPQTIVPDPSVSTPLSTPAATTPSAAPSAAPSSAAKSTALQPSGRTRRRRDAQAAAANALAANNAAVIASNLNAPVTGSIASADDANFTSTGLSGDMQHLTVGRSVSLRTAHRLTKVYVTNPAVLYAYTANPNEVLVTSKQPGISSVVVWDEAGAQRSYLFSSDIDTDRLSASIKQAMPSEDIRVLAEEGRIVLTGTTSTPGLYDAAFKLASLYSKDVSNALTVNSSSIKQVRLKVRIIEVDRSKLDQFAFNFFSAGGNNLAQTTTNQFPTTLTASTSGSSGSNGASSSSVGSKTVSVTNPLNFLLYSSRLNVGATLQDLEQRQVLQILAEPTITTLSGEKANFLAGGEFPFPVVQGGAGGLTSITIQFRPYGVRLEFLPIVNADGTIQLKVSPEVSALDYTNAVQISGYTIPAISTRRADTQVVLHSGQSFAISGLLDKRTTDQLGKTPGIANVPVLGALFKSKNINHSTTEILVLVTPEIVDPIADAQKATEEPNLPVPMLDPKTFDASMPKPKVKE